MERVMMRRGNNRMNLIRTIVFIIGISIVNRGFTQETVQVYGNQQLDSSMQFMQGFLHGGAGFLDSVAVAKLKPAFWRIGAYALAGSGYQETKRFQPKITVNINDLYMIINAIPSQTQSQPWTGNWMAWDDLVATVANNSLNNNEPVDHWDVWGEPDNFWTGTYDQWIEMYRRTDSILSSILPNPKIIGPEFGFGTCNFSVQPILQFLDSCYSVGVVVSGVSWHEFCQPHEVPLHVQQVRDSLAQRPWLGNLEILIPEYAGPANHTIPGWNVGWLHYLEKSKVDWVSHGCWTETDGANSWSNCEFGLNGLFMYDNQTPQPNYWVHRAYAELDSNRLLTNSTNEKIVALAGKNDFSQEMKIVVGKYDNPNLGQHNTPSNVVIKISNYPYCSGCVIPLVVQRIPSNTVNHSIPLLSPESVFIGTTNVVGDSLEVLINGFVDGDAYILYLNPTLESVLSAINFKEKESEIELYPNPASTQLQVNIKGEESPLLQFYNTFGCLVLELEGSKTSPMNISNLPNGIYFVQSKDSSRKMKRFVKCE